MLERLQGNVSETKQSVQLQVLGTPLRSSSYMKRGLYNGVLQAIDLL